MTMNIKRNALSHTPVKLLLCVFIICLVVKPTSIYTLLVSFSILAFCSFFYYVIDGGAITKKERRSQKVKMAIEEIKEDNNRISALLRDTEVSTSMLGVNNFTGKARAKETIDSLLEIRENNNETLVQLNLQLALIEAKANQSSLRGMRVTSKKNTISMMKDVTDNFESHKQLDEPLRHLNETKKKYI